MATETTIRLVDDLDGSDAVETIGFALDGKAYEIDLSDPNGQKLRDALSEFVGAAREVKPQRKGRGTSAKAGTEVSEARAWLKTNGYPVKDKGRITEDLMDVWRQNKDVTPEQETTEILADPETMQAIAEAEAEQAPELDTSDVAIIAWHQAKGYKVPDNGKVNGLMRHLYLKAHGQASGAA